jgi:hypothetical protein
MVKRNRIRRWLTGGVVIAAASFAPAAQARLVLEDPPASAGSSAPAQATNGPAVHQAGAASQSGFRWDDAGIGAAGTAGLLGAGVLASGAARRRRMQRTVVG